MVYMVKEVKLVVVYMGSILSVLFYLIQYIYFVFNFFFFFVASSIFVCFFWCFCTLKLRSGGLNQV